MRFSSFNFSELLSPFQTQALMKKKQYQPPTLGYKLEGHVPLIARLPTEILILVFEHGHQGRFTAYSHVVSSVCRYWRALALATPSLWSPISFADDGHPDYLARARLYLHRSKSYPVDIVVDCGMGHLLEKFWDDLAPHLSHCRSFSLSGDGAEFYTDLEQLGSLEAPFLDTLEISNTFPHLHFAYNTWSSPPRRPLFSPATLHNIRMDMVNLRGIDITRYFSLGGVRNFWLRWELPTEDHIDGGHRTATIVDTHVPCIIEAMPKLHALTLNCWDTAANSSLVPLLDKLPPSLGSLELNGISIAWGLNYGNWRSHDFSRLQTIKLSFSSTVEPTDAELFALLGIVADLRELYVGVVELLPHPSESVRPVHLARLETLTLDWVGTHALNVFLYNLEAPALTKTSFIISNTPDFNLLKNHSEIFIPPFWRSCPKVESITLSYGCTLSRNKDLIAALRDVLRNVKTLDLRGSCPWDDDLLLGLGTAPWPCPALESISFAYMPDLSQEALERCIRARKDGFVAGECAEMKKVGMRGCNRLSATDSLQALVDEVWHWI